MKIVILTGAGVSAESGIATYRDEGGIWTQYDMAEVASRAGYLEDPQRAADFFEELRRLKEGKLPNAAHEALARLEKAPGIELLIATQNIDGLHQEAGSENVIEMHGSLRDMYCDNCGRGDGVYPYPDHLEVLEEVCPCCEETGGMRPDVTYFGEYARRLGNIFHDIEECDIFAAIGTSGEVQPAGSFVLHAKESGATTIELNLERTRHVSENFDEGFYGPATEVVPMWVNQLIETSGGHF